MEKYSAFKEGIIKCGGLAGAVGATYLTTILMPSIIVKNATSAAAVAMNSTPLGWMPSIVEQVSVTAGAEAYVAAKATGWIGWSGKTLLASTSIGYTVGSKLAEFTIDGAEKIYEKVSSWNGIIRAEKNQAAAITCHID